VSSTAGFDGGGVLFEPDTDGTMEIIFPAQERVSPQIEGVVISQDLSGDRELGVEAVIANGGIVKALLYETLERGAFTERKPSFRHTRTHHKTPVCESLDGFLILLTELKICVRIPRCGPPDMTNKALPKLQCEAFVAHKSGDESCEVFHAFAPRR
jgi:hypothetical protein